MIRKALTYLTILAITALPVQLISASAEVVGMQMSMSQQMQASNECLHEMNDQLSEIQASTTSIENSCCNDQSHDCQSCNNCPQAASAMISSSQAKIKTSLLKISKISISHSDLNGVSQKNLLRPPRILI